MLSKDPHRHLWQHDRSTAPVAFGLHELRFSINPLQRVTHTQALGLQVDVVPSKSECLAKPSQAARPSARATHPWQGVGPVGSARITPPARLPSKLGAVRPHLSSCRVGPRRRMKAGLTEEWLRLKLADEQGTSSSRKSTGSSPAVPVILFLRQIRSHDLEKQVGSAGTARTPGHLRSRRAVVAASQVASPSTALHRRAQARQCAS
jgi:hypothetical protein